MRTLNDILIGCATINLLLLPQSLFGQRVDPVLPPQQTAPSVQSYDISALPLADALAEFGRQSHLTIRANAALLRGVRSHAISGAFTPSVALERLLQETGFLARFANEQTVVVTAIGAVDDEPRALDRVLVSATPLRQPSYRVASTRTATKIDARVRDIPQAVSIISSEIIADQSMQSMADVVRYVPGVSMSLGEGHRDQPTIRGVNTTADFFVDGIRDDAQYLRDLYNIDRVEVMKGANAMVFGRGGGGGVINRALKAAEWSPTRSFTFEGGAFDHKRVTLDVGQGLGQTVSARMSAVAERSGGFRDAAKLERYGINPTAAVALGPSTILRGGYEYFRDDRTVDRGVPSFLGRPIADATTTFFGNPAINAASSQVNSATATVEHSAPNGLRIRSHLRFADYDKFYQNTYPNSVNAAGTQATLSAYNHDIQRRNLFSQSELTYAVGTGLLRHTLLAGIEVGHQRTAQFRTTGYFANGSSSGVATLSVPLNAPTVATDVSFRQSATDADNTATVNTVSGYVQDQIILSSKSFVVLGLRSERFSIRYHNNRNGQELARTDQLLSPRAGLVLKPIMSLSFYGSYSKSFLPSTGDQFTALTVTSQTLKPEQFRNREVGAKWDVRPNLALTASAYQLDRTNTAAADPTDPARVVQTGAQRTSGVEIDVAGNVTSAWQVMGGFAAQQATISTATAAARAGATVPLVPHRTVSMWNRVQLFPPIGVGLGVVHQGEMYAGIDNTVRLPRFTRVDGAAFVFLSTHFRAQMNVENLLDLRYFATAFSNSNIMPGAPRTVRISVMALLPRTR